VFFPAPSTEIAAPQDANPAQSGTWPPSPVSSYELCPDSRDATLGATSFFLLTRNFRRIMNGAELVKPFDHSITAGKFPKSAFSQ